MNTNIIEHFGLKAEDFPKNYADLKKLIEDSKTDDRSRGIVSLIVAMALQRTVAKHPVPVFFMGLLSESKDRGYTLNKFAWQPYDFISDLAKQLDNNAYVTFLDALLQEAKALVFLSFAELDAIAAIKFATMDEKNRDEMLSDIPKGMDKPLNTKPI